MYVDAYKCRIHYANNTSNYLSELLIVEVANYTTTNDSL